MRSPRWLFALVALWLAPAASAQRPAPRPTPPVDSVGVVTLRLSDGSELTGRVVAADDTSLVLVTAAGLRVVVPGSAVRSWTRVAGRMRRGQFQVADPNTTRLFFGSTARTLRQGSGYFADYYLFFPIAGYGVHDRFMLSGGLSILPGASTQLFYIAPKIALVRQPTLNLALGGFYATVPGERDPALGAGYAVVTLGPEDGAVTLLAGYPFTTEDLAPEPVVLLGGEVRVGGRTKFLVEAWKLPEVDVVPTLFGLRWFGNKLAVDFGLAYFIGGEVEGLPFFPWVDFAVNW